MTAQELYEYLCQFSPELRSRIEVRIWRSKHHAMFVDKITSIIDGEEANMVFYCKGTHEQTATEPIGNKLTREENAIK